MEACMHGMAMVLAMVVMGVIFLISQVLILREFLLVFQGNEFSVGILLGSWLLLEALGSWLSGQRADRSRDPLAAFARVQVVLSLLLPVTLLLIRTNRHWLGASPWEVASYLEIWAVSLVVLGPLALANGAAFTYGCKLLATGEETRSRAPGRVYALESLGAFVGGLAFTFLLVGRAHSIEIAFCLGALSMGCVLLLIQSARGRQTSGETEDRVSGTRSALVVVCLLMAGFFLVGVVSPLGDRIHRVATEQRWSPLGLKESDDSIYGNIAVLELGEQLMLYQNGIPTITLPYPDTAAVETLVHLPLLGHTDPREVLVLGGGVGGVMAEALKHPLEALYYTELDPLLIRMTEEYATPSVRKELEDPRTRILYEDGRFFLRKTNLRVDVVLINLPEAATLQLNRFFTREFFLLVRKHLRPGGLLALSMPGSSSYLSPEMVRMSRCVWDTLEEVFPYVRPLPGRRILFLASRDVPVNSLLPGLLAERLEKRGVETSVIRPYQLSYVMDPWQGRWLREGLEGAVGTRTNRDLSPSLIYYTLAYKNAEVQPALRGVFPVLERMRFGVLLVVLLVLNLPFALWAFSRKGDRTPALSFAILSTGLVGMTMELVVILAFQSVYGYLYQWIGLLIAAFMAGLGCGAFLMTQMSARIRDGYRVFWLLECLQLGFLLVSAGGLVVLHGFFLQGAIVMGLPKVVLIGMNFVAGILVGSEFPLANREAGASTQLGVSIVAGRFYALDLAGAWLGTLLVSVLLVPLIGIGNTLLFAAVLKVCSLFYLRRVR
jgi:spermidine synthase